MIPVRFVAVLMFTAALIVPASAAQFTVFDAPGAGTGSGQGTFAGQVNFSSAVTGSYIDSRGRYHSFLRAPDGTFTTFEVDRRPTVALAINDKGVIAGWFGRRAFLRNADGTIVQFKVRNTQDAALVGINNRGESVGSAVNFYYDNEYGFFRRTDGSVKKFEDPDTSFGTTAVGINHAGAIVGIWYAGDGAAHGYVRAADGSFTNVDAAGAGTKNYQGTFPDSVNGKGWVAGYYIDANNLSHGFVRDPYGTITSFDAPGASGTVGGGGINGRGWVTGEYKINGVGHGYLRHPNGTIVEFDPPGAVARTEPQGINNHNIISGYFQDANGVYHGFVRTP